MAANLDADALARYLVDFGARSLPNLAEYFQRQFGFLLDPAHQFKRLFICEMADANVSTAGKQRCHPPYMDKVGDLDRCQPETRVKRPHCLACACPVSVQMP